MKPLLRLMAMSLALILPGAYSAVSVVVTPGAWTLYQGTTALSLPGGGGYLSQAACVDGARQRGIAATYTCRTMTVVAITIVPDPPPPVVPVVIVTQPVGASVVEGTPFAVTVVATGDPVLTYQWFKDGAAIVNAPGAGGLSTYAGQNQKTFAITSALMVDAGSYTVAVGNPAGAVMSAPAVIKVTRAPPPIVPALITTQPVSLRVIEGSAMSVSVAATGDAPITYKWFKDGVALPAGGGDTLGAIVVAVPISTAPTFTIPATMLTDAGVYTVVVSNAGGGVTSMGAVLSVTPKATGTATLSWSAPATKADGTPITDLAGYIVHYGRASRVYTAQQAVQGATTTTATITGLDVGTWYFGVTSVDSAGNESALDYEVSKTIP